MKNLNKMIPNRGKFLLTLMAFSLVLWSCSKGATNDPELEGGSTGLELDFYAYNVPGLDYTAEAGKFYKDISDVEFPVDKYGLLGSAQDQHHKYYARKNPALFIPHITPNAGQSKVQTYNIGGFEYSAWLRLTDNTKTTANASKETFNEPQGAILSVPFIDSNEKPLGSLFVAIFQDKPFPEKVPVIGALALNLCDNGDASDPNAGKGLCKNVALMMNFHEEENLRKLVIATARVPEIGTTANSMEFDPKKGANPQDREQVLKANGFHKVTLQVGDDVPAQDLGDGSFHGPTLRVLIDNKEVIVYKNQGGGISATHKLTKGWWDSVRDAGIGGKHNLSVDVFETVPEDDIDTGNKAPYVGYFIGASRVAPYSNGAKEYNQAWKNLVGDNSTGNMANMATFGLAFQLGATGKSPNAVTNDTLSPQLAKIRIASYHEGDNSGVAVAIDQIDPDDPTKAVEINGIGSTNLTATVTSTSSSDFSKAIRWESDNTNIAAVDTKGVVYSTGTGTATIKAVHIQSGATSQVNVKVNAVLVTGITLSQSTLNLAVNESKTVTVTNITPANANNKGVTWASDNATVASVNASSGKVTGVADGTANITATAADGSGITATVAVTVSTVPANSISFPSSYNVSLHRSKQLTPNFSPANTSNKTISSWVSADPSIATVDGSGNVKGIAVGTTTITATSADGSHTANTTVNVYNRDLISVAFDDGNAADSGVAGSLSNYQAFSHTYNFTFSPSDASVKTVTCTKPTSLNFMNVVKDGNGCKFSTNNCRENWQTLARVTATDDSGNVRTADITVTCK